MADKGSTDLDQHVRDLSLVETKASPGRKPAATSKKAVADSWEDESEEEEHAAVQDLRPSGRLHPKTGEVPAAPPPTPVSTKLDKVQKHYHELPTVHDFSIYDSAETTPSRANVPRESEPSSSTRPEKTVSTASRMIAAGLGVKPPRRTEEQKAYDQAARENERKRREKEKQDRKRVEEEREKAKREMWDG